MPIIILIQAHLKIQVLYLYGFKTSHKNDLVTLTFQTIFITRQMLAALWGEAEAYHHAIAT